MSQLETALVTGANRGIGRAIAERYAAGGFHVIVAARDNAKAGIVVDRIRFAGGSADTIRIDMGEEGSIDAAAKIAAARHSQIDALVNNAAVNLNVDESILVAAKDDIDTSIRTNALGPLELVKALLRQLKAAKAARIVNVFSASGSVTETADPNSSYRSSTRRPTAFQNPS